MKHLNASTRRILERHAGRRAQDVPTVTVLLGDLEVRVAARQIIFHDHPCVLTEPDSPDAVAGRWLDHLDADPRFLDWLSWQLKTRAGIQLDDFLARGDQEIRAFLDVHFSSEQSPSFGWMLREIHPFLNRPHCLRKTQENYRLKIGSSPWDLVEAICHLDKTRRWPGWLFWAKGSDLFSDGLPATAMLAGNMAERLPWLPIVIEINKKSLDKFLEAEKESRRATYLREGIVPLALDVVSPEKKDNRDDNDEEMILEGDERQTDFARSAAEQFLYSALQNYEPTRDLFCLNAKIAVDGQIRQISEIDLSCVSLKIALEIDGFFHFTSREAYRRDRRKDLLLQRAGWIVIRILADDVVINQERILDIVAQVVNERRQLGKGTTE